MTIGSNDKLVQSVRSHLEAVCKDFNKLAVDQAKVNDKRTGTYSGMIAAGIEAGTLEVFSVAYDGLKADINANTNGLGKRLGCKLSKPDKKGATTYTVPGGMMTAASVIRSAMAYKISLTDDKGEARSFGEIRTANAEAAKAEADAAADKDPAAKARREVKALCDKIAAEAGSLTESEAIETAKILNSLLKVADGSAGHKKAA